MQGTLRTMRGNRSPFAADTEIRSVLCSVQTVPGVYFYLFFMYRIITAPKKPTMVGRVRRTSHPGSCTVPMSASVHHSFYETNIYFFNKTESCSDRQTVSSYVTRKCCNRSVIM